MPCLLRSTERSSHASLCAKVRPGCDWAGPNRPDFDDGFRCRGDDRNGDAGGDGVVCPLLGILLYACILFFSFFFGSLSLFVFVCVFVCLYDVVV